MPNLKKSHECLTGHLELSRRLEDQLPPISIVVPTIAKDIPACARRWRCSALDNPQFEVVVVDNRVTPGPEIPALEHLRNVVVVRESVPGISAARNRGVRQARFDIVAFTDDDVEVDDRWLRAIGGRFPLNPEIDALGGLVLPARLATRPQLWFEEYFGGFSSSFELRIANQRHHPDDALFPYQPSRYAAGCNMALRKETLRRCGRIPTLPRHRDPRDGRRRPRDVHGGGDARWHHRL